MAGGDQGKARVWDVLTGKLKLEVDSPYDFGQATALSGDGALLALAVANLSTIRLWDIASGKEKTTIQGHDAPIYSVAFTPDGKQLATGGDNQHVHLWDAATSKHLLRFKGVSATSVAFSPDGKWLAAAGIQEYSSGIAPGMPLHIWDAATGKVALQLPNDPREHFVNLAFSADGGRLVTSTFTAGPPPAYGLRLKVWDPTSGRLLDDLKVDDMYPRCLAVAPDGKTVAVGGQERSFLQLIDFNWRDNPLKLLGHEGGVLSLAFAPDGKRLASGSNDNTVRIWDPANGKELAKYTGHEQPVAAVAFSPNGRVLASADGTDDSAYSNPKAPYRIRLWDVATGKEVGHLDGHGVSVTSLAFSPDGSRLASGFYDGTALISDVRKVTAGK